MKRRIGHIVIAILVVFGLASAIIDNQQLLAGSKVTLPPPNYGDSALFQPVLQGPNAG